MNIYWAAPLHDKEDQERNKVFVDTLRNLGYKVYLPQEHGVWEEFPDPRAARPMLYKLDLEAMQKADICVAYAGPRPPSEGMIWEMGYMTASNKPVFLLNPHDWDYNLMPEFGSHVFTTWESLITHLRAEDFV